jgi:hypothetical protein
MIADELYLRRGGTANSGTHLRGRIGRVCKSRGFKRQLNGRIYHLRNGNRGLRGLAMSIGKLLLDIGFGLVSPGRLLGRHGWFFAVEAFVRLAAVRSGTLSSAKSPAAVACSPLAGLPTNSWLVTGPAPVTFQNSQARATKSASLTKIAAGLERNPAVRRFLEKRFRPSPAEPRSGATPKFEWELKGWNESRCRWTRAWRARRRSRI